MAKSKGDVSSYFSKNAEEYRKTVNSTNNQFYINIGVELNRHLTGTVLDIGNGGVFVYDTSRLKQIIAVDSAFSADLTDNGNIKYLIGDARDLNFIENESCDFVVMQFVLHHIVEKKISDTYNSILTAFREAHHVLKPGGKLIIIEEFVFRSVECAEDILYGINRRILGFFNKPMIKFYSKQSLISRLYDANFRAVTLNKINFGSRWVEPFSALAPGLFKIPSCLFPARCYSVVAKKRELL